MMQEHWFIFQKANLLFLKQNDTLTLPTYLPVEMMQHTRRNIHLGYFNHSNCHVAEIDDHITIQPPLTAISLKKAFFVLGKEWYIATAKAYSVIYWDQTHQFCGRCGEKTIHLKGTFERACKHCGLIVYPRISPSMIVLIKKNDHLLMARSPHFPKGAYGLIAGFVEAGESIEDTVHREVKEEVGITVKNLIYFGSQAWPFPDSLMIGYIADYASGDIVVDQVEIEEAGWYRFDNLPSRPSSISLASKLIDHFIAKQLEKMK